MTDLRTLAQAVVDAPEGSDVWRKALDAFGHRTGIDTDTNGVRTILAALGELEAKVMPYLEAAYAQGYAKALADKAAEAEKETER